MRPILLHLPAPSLPAALLILALIAVGLSLWLLRARRRGALQPDHLYTGITVLLMSAVVLFLLARIGQIEIKAYGAMLMLGFLAGAVTAIKLGKRRGVPAERIMDLTLIILVGAIVGARVMYVLITPGEALLDVARVMKEGLGGLSFHGGLLGGILTGSAYIRWNKLPYWRVVDALSPAVAIGYAITRIGCFLNGCCFGKPTDLPWAIVFPHSPDLAVRTLHVHPTQLYASLMGLAMYGVLLLCARGHSLGRAGRLFMLLLVLEGIERFVMEIYRFADPHFQGVFTPAQVFSIVIVILGIAGWFLLPRRAAVDDAAEPAPAVASKG